MPENTPKKIDLKRREMPKQEAEVRSHNFSEVALGYTPELAVEEARRCLQCKKPFCVANCPVQINIPSFIAAVAQGDFTQGIRVLKQKNLLPSVCGRVCPQEEQCEKTAPWSNAAGRLPLAGWSASWAIGKPPSPKWRCRRSPRQPASASPSWAAGRPA